jgi:hypothetical protein
LKEVKFFARGSGGLRRFRASLRPRRLAGHLLYRYRRVAPICNPTSSIPDREGADTSKVPAYMSLLYFCLFVESVLAIPLAILHELELFLLSLAVLGCRIIATLALGTGKGDNFDILLLCSHDRSLRRIKLILRP